MELIDRSPSRDTPWDPLVQTTATMFGTRAREPHLGSGHVRPHQQTGHMAAIASIRNRVPPLASRGPSTYGSRRKAGTTCWESGGITHLKSPQGDSLRNHSLTCAAIWLTP